MKTRIPQPFLHHVTYLKFLYWGTGLLVVAVLAAGVGYAAWLVRSHDDQLRQNLLRQTAVIAKSIENEAIAVFWRRDATHSKAEINRLHDYFQTLEQIFSGAHSIYLLDRQPDGGIFFFSSQEDSTLSAHAANFARHSQASSAFEQVLRGDQRTVLGPFADQKELWLSALTPIRDPISGKTVAFLGVDTEYVRWHQRLRWPLLGIALVTLLMIACVVVGVWTYHLRQTKTEVHLKPLWEPLCLALFGLLLAAVGAWHVRQGDLRRQKALFQQFASRSTEGIANSLAGIKNSELESMAGYLETTTELTREKFDLFSRHMMKNPLVQALAWMPLVAAAGKDGFEAAIREARDPAFQIWQLSENGSRAPATGREAYYPILYFCPEAGNEFMLGFDHGSEQQRRKAMATARTTHLPTATGPLYFINNDTTGGKNIIVVQPIFAVLEADRLLGFSSALLRLDNLFNTDLGKYDILAMELSFLPSQASPQVLFAAGQAVDDYDDLRLTRPICEYGQVFLLTARPGVEFIYPAWRGKGLPIFLGGVLLTTALTVIMHLLLRYRQTLRDEVTERTIDLSASEAKYSLLFENMMGAFALNEMLYDASGKAVDYRFIEVNKDFEIQSGLKSDDIIGRTAREIFSGTRKFWIEAYDQVIKSGKGRYFKHYSKTFKRHYKVWAYWTSKSFFATFFIDVTEQVKMEEQLSLYFNTSADLFGIIGLDGLFLRVNPQWQHVLGYVPSDMVGKPYTSFVHPDDVIPTMQVVASLSAENSIDGFVNRYRHVDGSWHWLEWRAAVNEDAVFCSARDITERRLQDAEQLEANRRLRESEAKSTEMAKQAEGASRAKSDFLAHMSHEIRTPLNAVIGMADLLLEQKLSDIEQHYVHMIGNSGEALLGIVEDILDFSKIEAGQLELALTDFDLQKLVDDVIAMLSYKAAGKNLEMFCQVSPAVPQWVHGDSGRLRQILVNLIGNAIKFTEHGDIDIQVSLVWSESEHEAGGSRGNAIKVKFSVRDTGIGISEEQIGKLFKPFRQVDSTMTRKYGGTGLGLVISKQLAELMGGEIAMRSQPGQGTEVWFTVQVAHAFGRHADTLIRPEAIRRGLKVLLVGHPGHSELLAGELAAFGLRAHAVSTGAAALGHLQEAAASEPFAVVAMDSQLPDMEGITLAQKITAGLPEPAPAMILLDGSNDVLSLEAIREYGIRTVLYKPLKHQALLEAMAAVVPSILVEPSAVSVKAAVPVVDAAAIAGRLRAKRPHVLVVDDVAMNQAVLQAMLRKLGVRSDVAKNGEEALCALEKTSYDLVLMDVQMPVMDGLEATRTIRDPASSVLNHAVTIVATTAHAIKGDEELCLQVGMDDYISKPIRARQLAEMLAKWLLTDDESGPAAPPPYHEARPAEMLAFGGLRNASSGADASEEPAKRGDASAQAEGAGQNRQARAKAAFDA